MVGDGGDEVVFRKLDETIGCGVGYGPFALSNMAWSEVVGMRLWTTSSVRNIVGGVGKWHFALPSKAWWDMVGIRFWTDNPVRILVVVSSCGHFVITYTMCG